LPKIQEAKQHSKIIRTSDELDPCHILNSLYCSPHHPSPNRGSSYHTHHTSSRSQKELSYAGASFIPTTNMDDDEDSSLASSVGGRNATIPPTKTIILTKKLLSKTDKWNVVNDKKQQPT